MMNRNWPLDVIEIGERIAALTVARAVELSRYLEQVHGITATPSAPADPEVKPDRVVEEARVEPTEFDVLLNGFDVARRVAVIRAVRETTGLGLKEARDLVEAAPTVLKECLPRAEAEKLRAQMEAAGAKVVLRAAAA
jgi:large subunit ribosomal protein L7/L12